MSKFTRKDHNTEVHQTPYNEMNTNSLQPELKKMLLSIGIPESKIEQYTQENPSSAPSTPAPTPQAPRNNQTQRSKESTTKKSSSHSDLAGHCNLCNWKGYITFSDKEFANVRPCSCQGNICPQCHGEGGFEAPLPSGNMAWKKCPCQTLQRRMELFRNAKIPARFADKTLDAFAPNDQSQAKVRAHLYQLYYNPSLQRPFHAGDKGLVLMGSPGVGKTHLTVGFLRHVLLERGIPCKFQDFGLLLSLLRDCYARDLSEMEILEPLMNTDVLLLDDLGKGRNSKWESGIVDTLISHRYNTGKTTIVTTNYTEYLDTTLRERYRGRGSTEADELLIRDTLIDRLGERVYSRLKEMCDFFSIQGSDFRQK